MLEKPSIDLLRIWRLTAVKSGVILDQTGCQLLPGSYQSLSEGRFMII
jgi:hypothetical protein